MLIMRSYSIIFIALILSFSGSSQIENQPNWQFSYYGDVLFHPGIEIGYQIPLKNWTKVKSKKKKEVTKYKSLNAGIDFIYYLHRHHHHGLILSPSISYQRTRKNGRYFQAKFNLGYHRSVVDGLTYSVANNGIVESKRFVGQNTIYNSLAFDFGKNLRVEKEIPLRWFFQLGINGRYPYNKSYLPSLHMGFGIHFFIKNKL